MRKTRAAILPYPGDPFLLNYWLKFFDEVWSEDIDRLYIVLNSPIEEPVRAFIRSLCDIRPKIRLFEFLSQIDHGPAIDFGLEQVDEELVMLIEDDGFIFKKGIVDEAFGYLESGLYDIVGSKRGSCSFEILQKAKEVYNLDYEGEGDQGCNFWPNFFFSSKELLLRTDRNFGARAWKKGEQIESLGLTVTEELANGDTFVNTSLQLRAMVPESRIKYLPQYHGHPDDLEHHQRGKYLFDGQAPWTHVGSLSSGISGLLRDGNDRPLAHRQFAEEKPFTILPNYANTEMEKQEMERRVQWWLTFIEYFYQNETAFTKEALAISDFALLYQAAVEQIIAQYNLSNKNIYKRQLIYKEIMGNGQAI